MFASDLTAWSNVAVIVASVIGSATVIIRWITHALENQTREIVEELLTQQLTDLRAEIEREYEQQDRDRHREPPAAPPR